MQKMYLKTHKNSKRLGIFKRLPFLLIKKKISLYTQKEQVGNKNSFFELIGRQVPTVYLVNNPRSGSDRSHFHKMLRKCRKCLSAHSPLQRMVLFFVVTEPTSVHAVATGGLNKGIELVKLQCRFFLIDYRSAAPRRTEQVLKVYITSKMRSR